MNIGIRRELDLRPVFALLGGAVLVYAASLIISALVTPRDCYQELTDCLKNGDPNECRTKYYECLEDTRPPARE